MKRIFLAIGILLFSININAQNLSGSEEDRMSLDKATAAIRNAFAKGDAALVAQLHHPDIVKYFGGDNVVIGRNALQKGLTEWFKTSNVEFVENTVESTVFTGETAIQTVIFAIKVTPKAGGDPVTSRGRSIVVYVRDKNSPTGWYSLREMTQAAPDKK
ncbi:MAG TPA: nuclear transport factor 2 family protein [Chitinophagaceae bacterium]|jgi:ketosteroid isomerase-like protein